MLLADICTLRLLQGMNDVRYVRGKWRQKAPCCRLLCKVKPAFRSQSYLGGCM